MLIFSTVVVNFSPSRMPINVSPNCYGIFLCNNRVLIFGSVIIYNAEKRKKQEYYYLRKEKQLS